MLTLLKKIIISTLLSLFFFFIGSPLFHAFAFAGGGFIVTVGSSFGNCSFDAYHCEEIDTGSYLCQLQSEISHQPSSSIREIPSNQFSPSILGSIQIQEYDFQAIPECIGDNYKDPALRPFPFVRIIKIQV